jgi:release factor glutamine methyltransferase
MNVLVETPVALAQKAAAVLAGRGFENARLEAELLLAAVLRIRRLDLYLQHERPLDARELEAFRNAVRRRLRHEPLQYITGEAHFRQLVLSVDARALIPRPETEVLVGVVLQWARDRGPADAAIALDICTGSGAIALSLVHEGGFERVVATDISPEALALAAENARRLGLGDRVELRAGDVWTALRPGERFAAIVANPPYVAEHERGQLAPEIVEWEPAAALFAERDGYAVLDTIVAGAADHLEPGGLLGLEVGATQTERVCERVRDTRAFEEPRIIADLAGRPRIVTAVRAAEEGRA